MWTGNNPHQPPGGYTQGPGYPGKPGWQPGPVAPAPSYLQTAQAYGSKPAHQVTICARPGAGQLTVMSGMKTGSTTAGSRINSNSTPAEVLDAQLDAIQAQRGGLIIPLVKCAPSHTLCTC